jgi:hypothetical protein
MTEIQPVRQIEQITAAGAVDHLPMLMRLALLCLACMAVFYSLGGKILRAWDEYSDRYNFEAITLRGPLTLGQISRREEGEEQTGNKRGGHPDSNN